MAAASWVSGASPESDFSIQNLPYGIFTAPGRTARVGVGIGDQALDLFELAQKGIFDGIDDFDARACFGSSTLNAFMGHNRPVWQKVRARLVGLLSEPPTDPVLKDDAALQQGVFVSLASITMCMPARIGDYTDFYSSREHATNVGTMFRPNGAPLLPNWLHLPVGYHGRASSVYLSGTDVVRPRGQLQKDREDPSQGSIFGPCRLMDFELEMAFFVGGPPLAQGRGLTMAEAEDHIFGLVLMNDWSARDIQKWEYVPLGPFGAKNFATSISPWVVTLDALEPYRCPTSAGEQSDPVPLEYLRDPEYGSYDIALEVAIANSNEMAPGTAPATVCKSNFSNLYWNVKQQLVHHAVTGCNMQPGDLLGSGTISGSSQDSFGSMLELCWKGTREVPLGDAINPSTNAPVVRKFLKDGDKVVMTGACGGKAGIGRVGFGTVEGTVLPANTYDPAGPSPEGLEMVKNMPEQVDGKSMAEKDGEIRFSLKDKLAQLQEAADAGFLTSAEFDAAKKRIISGFVEA